MNVPLFDAVAREILRHYPSISEKAEVVPLGNHGGFSGAFLWRVEEPGKNPLCLRVWPAGDPSAARLGEIHHLMRRARETGLAFVPAVLATREGSTQLDYQGRLWEMTTWMPGRPALREPATAERVEAACATLARVHLAWDIFGRSPGPCPGVHRRLVRANEWITLVESGWQPPSAMNEQGEEIPRLAHRAWNIVRQRVRDVPKKLAPWADRPVANQACLCDGRGEHFLFEGKTISGLIDYGAVKVDHVAVDLARFFGSLVGGESRIHDLGFQAYERLRPLAGEEETLVGVLDETGTLLGAAQWLHWLYRERRAFENLGGVGQRLTQLVERLGG